MTKNEAASLMESVRYDDGKEPGYVMLQLRRIFERATPQERVTLNDVVRDWLKSENETDRFDAAYLTSEFRIVRNLDLIEHLRSEAKSRSDAHAGFEFAKYDRIMTELTEALQPDFAPIDPIVTAWAARNGLHVSTEYKEGAVRSIPVVDSNGREFQIWLDPDLGGYAVHAASLDRRQRFWRRWSSEPADLSEVEGHLDAALLEIRRWIATLDGKSYDEAGLA